jgi:hypothetical protein
MVAVFVLLLVLDVVALAYAFHDIRRPLFPPTSDRGHDHSHQEHYDQGDPDRDEDDHSLTPDNAIMKPSS